MKRLVNERMRQLWRTYYKATYRIAVFVACSVIMVLSFPGIGRFNYEYEIGRPWRYEDIIAPFDFPILKPEADLVAERDSAMKVALPYYVIDSINDVDLRVRVHSLLVRQHSRIEANCPPALSVDTLQAVIESVITSNVASVYRAGIIGVGEEINSSDGHLMLISANVAESFLFDDLYTPRSAYNTVVNHSLESLGRYFGIDARRFRHLLETLPISSLLEPNVRYDEEKTNVAKAHQRQCG